MESSASRRRRTSGLLAGAAVGLSSTLAAWARPITTARSSCVPVPELLVASNQEAAVLDAQNYRGEEPHEGSDFIGLGHHEANLLASPVAPLIGAVVHSKQASKRSLQTQLRSGAPCVVPRKSKCPNQHEWHTVFAYSIIARPTSRRLACC